MKNYIKHGFLLFEKFILANKIKFSEIEMLDYDTKAEIKKGDFHYALCIFPFLVSYNIAEVM